MSDLGERILALPELLRDPITGWIPIALPEDVDGPRKTYRISFEDLGVGGGSDWIGEDETACCQQCGEKNTGWKHFFWITLGLVRKQNSPCDPDYVTDVPDCVMCPLELETFTFNVDTSGGLSLNFIVDFLTTQDMHVDYGDGSAIEDFIGGTSYNPTHTYPSGGIITVTVTFLTDITSIDVSNNNVTEISDLSAFSLNYIYCQQNLLTTLPAFRSTLSYLQCSNNPIVALPSTLPNLVTLIAEFCLLTTVPPLVNTIVNMNLSNNSITTCPVFSTSSVTIDIGSNQLTTLQPIPANVLSFNTQNNQLTISAVSTGLEDLDANGLIGGSANFSNQTPSAPPDAGGVTAAANLTGKTWVINTD